MNVRKSCLLIVVSILSFSAHAEVPVDVMPKSLSLPDEYPDSWIFAHDVNYYTMEIGKYIVLDLAATSHQYKGVFQGAKDAAFVESKQRSELYVAETVYARGSHGQRTDVLTIYEKVNLTPIAEIILPGEKRALMVPHKGMLQLTHDEKFALVFNFTPAASVTVVDMDQRKVVNEVPVPGCTLIYPSGQRGFSTLCGNGSLASYALDPKGKVTNENISAIFNKIDSNVVYMTPAYINGVAYFPTEQGQIQAIDMSKNVPDILPAWSLTSAEGEKGVWRTSRGQSVASGPSGRLFVLMYQIDSAGQRQPGTTEVWVFDVTRQQRLSRIALKQDGYIIEVTQGKAPYLALVSQNGIDVYNATTHQFVQTIGGMRRSPVLLHASK